MVGLTVRSASPSDCFATLTVTAADGAVANTTVYSAVDPSATDSASGVTVAAGFSVSDSVAVTLATATEP